MGESDFIVPPPGLVPQAPRPDAPDRTVRAVPRTLPAFAPGVPLPAPPGRDAVPAVPAVPSVPASAGSAAPARAPAVPVWRLVAASGFEVVVDGPVVLGRDPLPNAVPGARPVAVDDPARTVSKTHAFAEPVAEGLRVTDLRSTNGVRVEAPGEPMSELSPDQPALVVHGAALYLGEFGLRVDGATR